ncbi:MAG: acetyltransferase [Candidatus Calescibacterium sp.]|nr:acetyltransferase [Candidatus Calescibacterium sp.]
MDRKVERVVILGAGGHSKVIQNIIDRDYPEIEILGYIDRKKRQIELGYLGTEDDITNLNPKHFKFVMGIGQVDYGIDRKKLIDKLVSMGFEFLSIISKKSIIAKSSRIGRGTVVLDQVVINVDSQIGDFCILNTGSIVEHDCFVGNFVHLAPRATVSGGVKIGNHCFLGAGTVVKHYVSICDNVIVGAGGVVVKDIDVSGVYVGVPAKKVNDL